jgi:hypothetical protein
VSRAEGFPWPPFSALTGLDLQFEIFATVPAATSAPACPDVPGAGLRRHLPGGRLSTPPADPKGPPRRTPAADDDDVRAAAAALLAAADAWRDADAGRRFTAPFACWPARTPALTAPVSSRQPGHCWPAPSATRSPIPRRPPRRPPDCGGSSRPVRIGPPSPDGPAERPGPDNTARIGMVVLTRSGYGGNSCSCHSACEILTAGAADSRVRLLTTGGRSSPGSTYVDPDIVPVGESAKWLKVQ